MKNFMCVTCGVQYAASDDAPGHCRICDDPRQYVGPDGQQWTTLDALKNGHSNVFTLLQPGLSSIVTTPRFAISQRAHLVRTPNFNLLWDCISLIDQSTLVKIQAMGGLAAIALSHPHYYSTIVDWSRSFGHIPIYVHADDRQWITRPDPVIRYWEGDSYRLADGLTLVRCGGHFDGASVLHWDDAANNVKRLLVGDTIYVVSDSRYVSFMYSYPNLIPLPVAKVEQIVQALAGYDYEQIYDAFGRVILQDGKAAVLRSAERYVRAIRGG